MRDWPPCSPIQRNGGRRSRPGVNPFISALTVACCPATFPGVWPHFGTLCPQVGAKDEGRWLSYTCRRSRHVSRYNTLHFASKVVCQRGHPFGNPGQQNRRYAALSGSIPPFVVSSPIHGLRVVPCKLT